MTMKNPPHPGLMPNAPGVSARIVQNSHPAKTAVATADRAKSRLARALGRRHQTSTCTSASVRQADAIIAQMMVTQIMASQWVRVRRRLNMARRSLPAAHAQRQPTPHCLAGFRRTGLKQELAAGTEREQSSLSRL